MDKGFFCQKCYNLFTLKQGVLIKQLADKYGFDMNELSDAQLKNKLMKEINIFSRFLPRIPKDSVKGQEGRK